MKKFTSSSLVARVAGEDLLSLLAGRTGSAYVFTVLTEFVTLLCMFLTLWMAARLLGSLAFGEYMLARRAISILAPIALVGVATSVPRYVALAKDRDSPEAPPVAYYVSGLLVTLAAGAVIAGLVVQHERFLGALVFGTDPPRGIVLSTVVAAMGTCMHLVNYGCLRGQLRLGSANLLQLLNLGVVPPMALIVAPDSAARAIAYTGIGWIMSSIAAMWWAIHVSGVRCLTLASVSHSTRQLLRYGAPRVLADLGLPTLFGICTFAVARDQGLENAGFFAFGVSLLQLLASVHAPASILLLPIVSRLAVEKRWCRIRRLLARISLLSLVLTALLVLTLQVALEPVVRNVLGTSFVGATGMVRWIVLGAFPTMAYMILRSPLDALDEWPHNASNLVIAVVTASVLVWIGGDRFPAYLPLLSGLLVLGGLSLVSWRRTLKFSSAAIQTA
jgi:O-antigen/teichoic acid export membrane protein